MARHLLSELAHVELLTPRPEATVDFFHSLLGLEVSARGGRSVYMRGWGEDFHHSLKVTEAAQPGLGHVAWRTDGEEELEPLARALEASGRGEGWSDGDTGHGRAYRFRSPEGHPNEVFWEVERFRAPPELSTSLLNRPQRYTGRGAAARNIDHVGLSSLNVRGMREFYQGTLGFKHHEGAVMDGAPVELAAFMAVTAKSHELSLLADRSGVPGRLNHVAYWLDTREEVLRAADLARDAGPYGEVIEFGPSKHGATEGFFLYLREPGGNRVELFSGGHLHHAPDWGPVLWKASEHSTMAWTGDMPMTMYSYATPDVGGGAPAPVPAND